eukprot:gene9653-12913_t
MWHMEFGAKTYFMGKVVLGGLDLLTPPKGIRAYRLRNDPDPTLRKMGRKRKFKISGSLFVRVAVLRRGDKFTSHGDVSDISTPLVWRVQ